MYNNVIDKAITKYWKGRFNDALDHLKHNFSTFRDYERFMYLFLKTRLTFHSISYFLLRNYKINKNDKYSNVIKYHRDANITKYIRKNRRVSKHSDGFGRYNWLYEGCLSNTNKEYMYHLKGVVIFTNTLGRDASLLSTYESSGNIRCVPNIVDLFRL